MPAIGSQDLVTTIPEYFAVQVEKLRIVIYYENTWHLIAPNTTVTNRQTLYLAPPSAHDALPTLVAALRADLRNAHYS